MGEVGEVTLTLEPEARAALLKGYLCWDYGAAAEHFGSVAGNVGVDKYAEATTAREELLAAEERAQALGWQCDPADSDSPVRFTADAKQVQEIVRLELGHVHDNLSGAEEDLADFRKRLREGLALADVAEQLEAALGREESR